MVTDITNVLLMVTNVYPILAEKSSVANNKKYRKRGKMKQK
jgi:hypothetical protein